VPGSDLAAGLAETRRSHPSRPCARAYCLQTRDNFRTVVLYLPSLMFSRSVWPAERFSQKREASHEHPRNGPLRSCTLCFVLCHGNIGLCPAIVYWDGRCFLQRALRLVAVGIANTSNPSRLPSPRPRGPRHGDIMKKAFSRIAGMRPARSHARHRDARKSPLHYVEFLRAPTDAHPAHPKHRVPSMLTTLLTASSTYVDRSYPKEALKQLATK
jgi:hypothetical protein